MGYNINLVNFEMGVAVKSLATWMTMQGLSISTNKSSFCTFTRHKFEHPPIITLDTHNFDYVNHVKFLGMYLDCKLEWTYHIQNIIKTAELKLNILRSISHVRWGSDINSSLMVYHSFVRSSLDYGSAFYGMARKTQLKKLDLIHNKAIRLCLGALRSTPIDILMAEAGEFPLPIRRQWLADKFVLGQYEKKSALSQKIHHLFITTLTAQFWINKQVPLYIDSYSDNMEKFKLIHCCEMDYSSKLLTLLQRNVSIKTCILSDYSDYPEKLRNSIFKDDTSRLWPNATLIYTDGSKLQSNVGAAVYIPAYNIKKTIKLPAEATVYTAELIAIHRAIKLIDNLSGNKFVILSDCKSIILKLSNIKMDNNYNHILIEILNEIFKLNQINKNVLIVWLKGHCGIEGNVVVDELAKQATTSGTLTSLLLPRTDLYPVFKQRQRMSYQSQYSNNTTGQFYKSYYSSPPKMMWYKGIVVPKDLSTTMTRLRSNHGLFLDYKFRLGMTENPYCICGQMGDAEHFLMHCTVFSGERRDLLNIIHKSKIEKPFNFVSLVFSNNHSIYTAIHKFFKKIKLKI